MTRLAPALLATLPSKGWGPFRQEFYSLCSSPRGHDPECVRCATGRWVNCWGRRLGHAFYATSPRLWRLWANRRWCNPSRRFLEKTFPGLRGE